MVDARRFLLMVTAEKDTDKDTDKDDGDGDLLPKFTSSFLGMGGKVLFERNKNL
jgi:hypothetical protein